MKKLLIVLMVLAFCIGTVQAALTYDGAYYLKNRSFILSGGLSDPIYGFINEIDNLQGSAGTGEAFYVDSDVATEGDGGTWARARDTLQEAIDLCVANRGDIIYVAQGHAENIATAAAIDVDCAGVTIRGMGVGNDMPEFSLTAQASTFQISAADVSIYNVRFYGAFTNGTTNGVDVTAAGDGFQIIGCEFQETSNTMELLTMLTVTADADRGVIAFNRFIGTNSSDNTDCIDLEGGSDKTIIAGNTFIGTWSDNVIDGTAALSTGLMIYDNFIINLDSTAGKTIQCHSSTGGAMIGNKCYANGAGFALVGDAMFVCPISNVATQIENTEGALLDDKLGAFTGPIDGAAVDDNIKAATDHLGVDTDAIIVATTGIRAQGVAHDANMITETDAIDTATTGIRAQGVAHDANMVTQTDLILAQGRLNDANMVTATDAIVADFTDYALDHLASASAGTGAFPTDITNDSILALLMSDDATADVNSYNNTTDSFEAIGVKTTTIDAELTLARADINTMDDLIDTEVATIDNIVDNILAQLILARVDINDVETDTSTTLDDFIDTEIATIDAELTLGRVDINDIETDTGTTLPALITGNRQVTVGNWNFTADTGATNPYTIFTVTGDILCTSVGVADVALLSTPLDSTVELGVSGNTAICIAQIAAANDLAINEIWQDATPTATVEAFDYTGLDLIITNGQDIIFTIGGTALTAGDIDFYLFWVPLSSDASVSAN